VIQPEQTLPSERDYLAPSVYRPSNRNVSNWNYYSSFWDADKKWKFLNNQGGQNIAPTGIIYFSSSTQPQTLGINVDFYILVGGLWQLTSYKYLRTRWSGAALPPVLIRFYTKEGNGPYYAIGNNYQFAIAATTIQSVTAEKLAALDGYYREVQLMKYRYNAFMGFLNSLAKYQSLSPTVQRVYNEGLNLMKIFSQQMSTVRAVEIQYAQGEKIGALPILAVIAIVALLAGAAGWTITAIMTEKEKTKRINDAYELNKWVANKKVEVGAMVEQGSLSETQASDIYKQLNAAAETGNKVAEQESKNKGLFGDIADIVKWGVLGLIGFQAVKMINNKKS
jgi:hypothetical protein